VYALSMKVSLPTVNINTLKYKATIKWWKSHQRPCKHELMLWAQKLCPTTGDPPELIIEHHARVKGNGEGPKAHAHGIISCIIKTFLCQQSAECDNLQYHSNIMSHSLASIDYDQMIKRTWHSSHL